MVVCHFDRREKSAEGNQRNQHFFIYALRFFLPDESHFPAVCVAWTGFATLLNPKLRGWINYYTKYYRHKLWNYFTMSMKGSKSGLRTNTN
jgi:hypothetical protein